MRVRRFAERHAAVLVESRLGIKGFDVAGATLHKQPNDTLGLRSKVRLAIGRNPRFSACIWLADAVAVEHGAENHARYAHTQVREKASAVHLAATGACQQSWSSHQLSSPSDRRHLF